MKLITKSVSIILSAIIIILCFAGCGEEKKAAIAAFEAEVSRVSEEESELNSVIEDCEALIIAAATPYDPDTFTALETDTSKVRASIKEIPKMPAKTESINETTESLKAISYTDSMKTLQATKAAYEKSLKIQEQITNPSEEFVIACLEKVSGITGISAATEDNDPNRMLHKAGGYTSAVFFSHENVDQSRVYGDSIIEKGTDGGGQIEVYETTENAEKRSNYLATFDGTVTASGSHTVLGTILIRTSNYLTATQQKELENEIITIFTTLAE